MYEDDTVSDDAPPGAPARARGTLALTVDLTPA